MAEAHIDLTIRVFDGVSEPLERLIVNILLDPLLDYLESEFA